MLDLSLNSSIYTNDIWEAAIQEIDIIFATTNTELLGYPEFGTNFDEFLWTLTPTTGALQEYIEKQLRNTSFVSKLKYHLDINCKVNVDTYENEYKVTITLYDDDKAIEKTYNLAKTI